MWIRNFRIILLISYIPSLLTVAYICILPQSEFSEKLNHAINQLYLLTHLLLSAGIRWLITKGKVEEAKKILLRASKINKTSLSENSLTELNAKLVLQKTDDSVVADAEGRKTSVRVVLQILNVSFLWFATIFVYYGLNINAIYLEYWNKYISFIVSL